MKSILLFLLTAAALCAQPSKTIFTTFTATGTTSSFAVPGADVHTIQAVVTGGPSGCTMHLEGSLDGTTWADISGDQTCTSSVMFHVVNKGVNFVRVNLSSFTGGTSPTLTAWYVGHSTGK